MLGKGSWAYSVEFELPLGRFELGESSLALRSWQGLGDLRVGAA